MDRSGARGLQAALVAYVGWGLLTIYWKQLAGFSALDLVGWRVGTAAIVMAAIVTYSARWRELAGALRVRRTLAVIVAAALTLTLNWSTYVWAIVNDRVIETALGYFLAPLATVAVGVVAFGERLTTLKAVASGCAGAAIVVLVVSYGKVPWVAIVLALTWSAYAVAKRNVALDPIASLTGELLVLSPIAAAVMIASFARADGLPHTATATQWPLALGTGVITAAPLLLFAYAAKRLPFTILGPTNYLVPVINFLLGWLAYDEDLPASRIVGFVLVWVALTLVTIELVRDRSATGHVIDEVATTTP